MFSFCFSDQSFSSTTDKIQVKLREKRVSPLKMLFLWVLTFRGLKPGSESQWVVFSCQSCGSESTKDELDVICDSRVIGPGKV